MPSTLRHSIIFFTLSCLFLGTLKNDLSYWETGSSFLNILCLFLILTIGISHGALDHLKGYKLLTDEIILYNNSNLVKSNKDIIFTSNHNDTLYGIGFWSNFDMSNSQIQSPKGSLGK